MCLHALRFAYGRMGRVAIPWAEARKMCQRWAVYEPGPRGQSEDLDERSPSPRWLAWLKGVETG